MHDVGRGDGSGGRGNRVTKERERKRAGREWQGRVWCDLTLLGLVLPARKVTRNCNSALQVLSIAPTQTTLFPNAISSVQQETKNLRNFRL